MEGLEGLIDRLLEGRNNRGKRIQLTEPEIRQLCVTAKQVFLAQPILLELEAPINICGISFHSLSYSILFIYSLSFWPFDMTPTNIQHCSYAYSFRIPISTQCYGT